MDDIDRLVRGVGKRPAQRARGDPRPALRLAILTCMDARIDPVALFALHPGDAHVIRNAGGLATPDAVESVGLSQEMLGTRRVMVLQHAHCSGLAERLPGHTVEQSVATAMRLLRGSHDLLHTEAIRGFVLDLAHGSLREVRLRPQAPAPSHAAPGPTAAPGRAAAVAAPEARRAALAHCTRCGRAFEPTGGWHRTRRRRAYCSDLCRLGALRAGR